MLEKPKLSFHRGLITIKANIEFSGKETEKYPRNDHYCLDGHLAIDDWDFTLFEQCETHKQLKERKTFWQHRLKTFYLLGLNEKEKYLYEHTPYMRVRQSIMVEFWLSFSFINLFIIDLFKFVR